MKNQKEIYEKLLSGETLVNTLNQLKVELNKLGNLNISFAFEYPRDWVVLNPKIEGFKKAYSEGAIIESLQPSSSPKGKALWKIDNDPKFSHDVSYRIKDALNVEAWEMWKDVIKAYWRGETIEFKLVIGNDKWDVTKEPLFVANGDFGYRVKPELEYEWQWIVKKSCSDPFTMTGYHTREKFVDIGYYFVERYEISKRVKTEGKL